MALNLVIYRYLRGSFNVNFRPLLGRILNRPVLENIDRLLYTPNTPSAQEEAFPIVAILICFLSTAQMCGTKEDVSPEGGSTACFSKESLTTVAWQKDQLAFFQQPKSGMIRAVLYSYKNEDFLASESAWDNGQAGHIVDCSGTSLGKRGINYNEFYSNNKKINVMVRGPIKGALFLVNDDYLCFHETEFYERIK